MSKKQYILICALSALCLVLAVEEQRLAEERRIWQNQAASLQARMDGSLSSRLGSQRIDALFQDLENASLNNNPLRQLLRAEGVAVNSTPPPETNSPASGIPGPQP